MIVKKAGGKVYGAIFTAAEKKAMDMEINRQIIEADRRYTDDIDAMVLYNKSSYWYLLYDKKEPVRDEDGNETGDSRVVYKAAVQRRDNVSAATGSAQVEQFGNFISYDKVIVTDDLSCPIDENTVLFVDKEPEYDADDNPLYDYIVRRVAKSLNSISYAISKVTVS